VELKTRDQYKKVEISFAESQEENEQRNDFNKLKIIEMSENEVLNLKAKSPFTKYFTKMIARFNELITTSFQYNVDTDQPNPFFNPFLLTIIKDRLYHLPLWTGVLLNSKTRLTNNPVECFFKIIKQHSMKNNRLNSLMPSEISSMIFNRSLSKFKEFYEKDDSFKKSSKLSSMDSASEKWKSKARENPRKKGYYYQNADVCQFEVSLDQNIQNTIAEKANEIDFQESFGLFKFFGIKSIIFWSLHHPTQFLIAHEF
jgi:hypothetical protein